MGKLSAFMLATMVSFGTLGSAAGAADYPTRPITIVVGFPPGGSVDAVARTYAEALSKELKQPVIVENKAGAGGTIAASYIARAKPDGYTVYISPGTLMGGDQKLYKNLGYTPDDFIPITRLTQAPLLLIANKDTGIKTVADLIARAKQNPGKIFYSSSGNGVVTHLAGVQFNNRADVKLEHVPYKGGAPSVLAVSAGDVQVSFATVASARAAIEGGRAVGLAVTSPERSFMLPEYPTIAEEGVPGYALTNYYGLFVPAGTPESINNKLFDVSQKILAQPEVKSVLMGVAEGASSSKSREDFKKFAQDWGKNYVELIVAAGANID